MIINQPSIKSVSYQVEHVELDEFLEIIADIQDAGWAVKVVRENEIISDQAVAKNICQGIFHQNSSFPNLCVQDLKHVFDKVDRNKDQYVNRMVSTKKKHLPIGLHKCCFNRYFEKKAFQPPLSPRQANRCFGTKFWLKPHPCLQADVSLKQIF